MVIIFVKHILSIGHFDKKKSYKLEPYLDLFTYLLGHNFGFLFLSRRVCDISSVDDATRSKKERAIKWRQDIKNPSYIYVIFLIFFLVTGEMPSHGDLTFFAHKTKGKKWYEGKIKKEPVRHDWQGSKIYGKKRTPCNDLSDHRSETNEIFCSFWYVYRWELPCLCR